MIYFFIGIGGIIGSLFRYLVSIITNHLWTGTFPFGTIIANILGSYLLSFITRKYSVKGRMNDVFMLAIGTGGIGSFTTMSTFSMETVHFIHNGDFLFAIIYVAVSLIAGLAAAYLGYYGINKQKCRVKNK